MSPDPGNPSRSPEDLFAQFAVRVDAGEPVDFEQLCVAHTEAASRSRPQNSSVYRAAGPSPRAGGRRRNRARPWARQSVSHRFRLDRWARCRAEPDRSVQP